MTKHAMRQVRILVAMGLVAGVALLGMSPVDAKSDRGTRQLAGVAEADFEGCDPDADGVEYTEDEFVFPLRFDGEAIEGCWYVITEEARTRPSGNLQETGRDVFVGTLDGEEGTFLTRYILASKWGDLENFQDQQHGFCQHTIVDGDGAFEGMRGIVHLRDDVTAGNFPWTAQLRQR